MLNVLVVDDEVLLLSLLQDILESEGHRVVTASDALDAITHMEANHFDVVITDHDMPHLTGGELSHWIRKNSPDSKIILSSGMYVTGHESSCDHVLDKPYEYESLLGLLSSIKEQKFEDLRSNLSAPF